MANKFSIRTLTIATSCIIVLTGRTKHQIWAGVGLHRTHKKFSATYLHQMLSHLQEKIATPQKLKLLPMQNPFKWLTGTHLWLQCYRPLARMSALSIGVGHARPAKGHSTHQWQGGPCHLLATNSDVRKSGQPSFESCRIPVGSNFNFEYLEQELGPGSLRNFHVKIHVSQQRFQTWHLIGWQHSCQPIRSHVRKSMLTNMEFNMDFT